MEYFDDCLDHINYRCNFRSIYFKSTFVKTRTEGRLLEHRVEYSHWHKNFGKLTDLSSVYTGKFRFYVANIVPVYMVPDSCGHDIEFGQFAVIFILTIFSMISCC